MRNFQSKRSWKNILHSRPILIFLGVLLFIFAWVMVGFFRKMELTRENREIAEVKVAQLEEQKLKLSADISRLKTQSGLEDSIREKFGLVKEGEGMIVVVEDQNLPEAAIKESGGFLFFLKNLFK